MLNQNYEIYLSVTFYIIVKFLCYIHELHRASMYQRSNLISIPESSEVQGDAIKWVPKKKHEVLKAKYKCLKKLFQIYDASVIGILPEHETCHEGNDSLEKTKHRRKKRSHRTRTDACAGTTEVSSGDVTAVTEYDSYIKSSDVINDLKTNSCISTQIESVITNTVVKVDNYAATQYTKVTEVSGKECECTQTSDIDNHVIKHRKPYLMVNDRRKPTRFQSFIHRILGLKREKNYKNYVPPNGHVYAASDNNIVYQYVEKRRRRGFRFRRLRRPKKIYSEGAIRGRNPAILNYVQCAQKNCLLDTTPRQCPIAGCGMMFYGIINYNDHINLCHFTERKFICVYCHEGFEKEHDKFVHENSHIGITKLANIPNPQLTTVQSFKKASVTQTEPELQDEKLKKIVSFFDKIVDSDDILNHAQKNRYSEMNLQSTQPQSTNESVTGSEKSQKTVSCVNVCRKNVETSSAGSDVTSKYPVAAVKCHFCGENFDYRRQLSLHVDLEHRIHDKFSKFHSCAGIVNTEKCIETEEGVIGVHHTGTTTTLKPIETSTTITEKSKETIQNSQASLSYDPSTNIVYYSSLECVKKVSKIDSLIQKVRGITSYKWEPETKIIRV